MNLSAVSITVSSSSSGSRPLPELLLRPMAPEDFDALLNRRVPQPVKVEKPGGASALLRVCRRRCAAAHGRVFVPLVQAQRWGQLEGVISVGTRRGLFILGSEVQTAIFGGLSSAFSFSHFHRVEGKGRRIVTITGMFPKR
jgi:hypothetical protein